MSSDDYALIRKRGGRFYLSVESASVAPRAADEGGEVFGLLEDACRAGQQACTEYGIRFVDLDGGDSL